MRGSGSQFAYDEVRRQIVTLELRPGARLFEEALAASLGVSRTPLREALRQLESERLLERLPAGGLSVPVLDAREISELYDCRAALEGLMAGEAARVATTPDIDDLQRLVARNEALVHLPEDAMLSGKAIHSAISRIADNAWSLRLHEQVAGQMERYRRYTNQSADRRDRALEEHRGIVAAIATADPSRAALLAHEHVTAARDEVLRVIDSVGLSVS
ncbi:GntR family transcriptional regulator [Agrococcus terreus]|uniref:GntR family transcriptional regulator n=1 Tax=Agrococcus terreus TaxID=574649 RepID=A0ABQ2KJ59_9MICO|nr:GntR family transcriptional regulator [Agrococcus terreus]GGN85000.1 GntR family transcriptional regulator [Agrococcus terreus]